MVAYGKVICGDGRLRPSAGRSPALFEAVTKLVPSAKADSVASTSDYPDYVPGFHIPPLRGWSLFVSPPVVNTEFRTDPFCSGTRSRANSTIL